jgi:AraC family ethanolamine operon transcriptional activator
MAVSVPIEVWEQCRALAGDRRASFGSGLVLRLPPPVYARIEQRLESTRQLLREGARTPHLAASAADHASDLAAFILTTAWELSSNYPPEPVSLRNRARLARRAEAWMREHLADCVRIPDVCLALRVSRRELEYAFRSTFDQSPRDFLHALRLNAIRRALLRRTPEETILHALLAHGITHPSRFAAEYRQMFGVLPSSTPNIPFSSDVTGERRPICGSESP